MNTPSDTITRLHQNARMSKVVMHRGLAYFSAQVTDDPTQNFEAQTRNILDKIEKQLADIGSSKAHILSATVYIDSAPLWPGFNAIWEKWVVPGHLPARTCVEAKLAFPEYLIEISIIATC